MIHARREDSSVPSDPRYRVELGLQEFEFLEILPQRLRSVLLDPESSAKVIDRLFPRAYRDAEDEEDHRRLMGRALYTERLEILRGYDNTLEKARPSPDGLGKVIVLGAGDVDLWLHVLNDLRLLIGTELDIKDNEWFEKGPASPEESMKFQVLASLSAIQEILLAALSGAEGRTAD